MYQRISIVEADWIGNSRTPTLSEAALLKAVRGATEQKINHFVVNGLPENYHQRLQHFSEVLCEKADILLYPTQKTLDEAYKILDGLTDAIAVLAFVPGGIEIFGNHYQVLRDGSGKA